MSEKKVIGRIGTWATRLLSVALAVMLATWLLGKPGIVGMLVIGVVLFVLYLRIFQQANGR